MQHCQDCINCRIKYWFMFCRMRKWEWEMLNGSKLSVWERKIRPFLSVPDRFEEIGKDCKKFEDMGKEVK